MYSVRHLYINSVLVPVGMVYQIEMAHSTLIIDQSDMNMYNSSVNNTAEVVPWHEVKSTMVTYSRKMLLMVLAGALKLCLKLVCS